MPRTPLMLAVAATAVMAAPAVLAQTPPPSTQPVPTLPVEPADPAAPPTPDMSITSAPAATADRSPPVSVSGPVVGASAPRLAPPGATAPNGQPAATIITVSSPPVPHPTDGQVDGQRRPR